MKAVFIDIGSTYIKYRFNRGTIEKIPFPMRRARQPFFEADAEEISAAVQGILNKFPFADAAFFSVQMHGYVLRKKNGKLLPYVSWRDRRAEGVSFSDAAPPPRSGTSLKANSPRVSVLYRVFTGELRAEELDEIFTLGSFIVWRLTGLNATHITDAAPLGMYDLAGGSHPVFGLKLPQTAETVRCFGKYKNIRIYAPVGDVQAAIYSLPADLRENSAVLNLGTAAQICVVGGGYIEFGKALYECRPFFQGQYLYTATGLNGGDWIGRNAFRAEAVRETAENYRAALGTLPRKDGLAVVGGGVAEYHGEFLRQTLERLQKPYIFTKASALGGLLKLTETIHE